MGLVRTKLVCMDLNTYISTSPRGTASKLAAALGISPSYLSQMSSGTSPISPERSVAIERETAGAVPRKETHPNDWWLIWPELDGSEAARAAAIATDDIQPPTGGLIDDNSPK